VRVFSATSFASVISILYRSEGEKSPILFFFKRSFPFQFLVISFFLLFSNTWLHPLVLFCPTHLSPLNLNSNDLGKKEKAIPLTGREGP
jgi:hypothetical protein